MLAARARTQSLIVLPRVTARGVIMGIVVVPPSGSRPFSPDDLAWPLTSWPRAAIDLSARLTHGNGPPRSPPARPAARRSPDVPGLELADATSRETRPRSACDWFDVHHPRPGGPGALALTVAA